MINIKEDRIYSNKKFINNPSLIKYISLEKGIIVLIDNILYCIDTNTGEIYFEEYCNSSINDFDINSYKTYIASIDYDNSSQIKVMNFPSKKNLFYIPNYCNRSIKFFNENLLFIGFTLEYKNSGIIVWDVEKNVEVHRFLINCRDANSIAISSDKKYIAVTGGFDREIKIFNLDDYKLVKSLTWKEETIVNINRNKHLKKFKKATNSIDIKVCLNDEYPYGILFSPNSKLLAIYTENSVKIWDTNTWELLFNLFEYRDLFIEGFYQSIGYNLNISFSMDSKILACSFYNPSKSGTIFFDLSNEETNLINYNYFNVVFSNENKLIYCSTNNNIQALKYQY